MPDFFGRRFGDADEVPGHGPEADRPRHSCEVVGEARALWNTFTMRYLAAVIEPSQCCRGRLIREDFLVCRCGRTVVDENHFASRRERGGNVFQKWDSRVGGTRESQKAKNTVS